MGLRDRWLVWGLVGAQCAFGCGGRAFERTGVDQDSGGSSGYGPGPSDAGAPSQGGGPVIGGAPNSAGAPSDAGAPSHGGAPLIGGGPNAAGAPSYAGAPVSGGAPSYAGGAPVDPNQPWEVQQLARIRAGIVGTWVGDVSNPWASPCKVRITFTSDGHYSAHSPGDDTNCVVLYYGTNDDSPEKTYLIDDVTAAAEGVGMLEIFFSPGDTNEGQMKAIALTPDNGALTFRVYKGEYGPLVFTLRRA